VKNSTKLARYNPILGVAGMLSLLILAGTSQYISSATAQEARSIDKPSPQAADALAGPRTASSQFQAREVPDELMARKAGGVQSLTAMLTSVETEGSVRVIVGLQAAFQPEGSLRSLGELQSQQAAIADAQDGLLSRMSGFGATAVKRYTSIPFLAMEVNAAGLQYLLAVPEVTTIQEDVMHTLTLAESVPLIGAPAAWASGFTGAGQTVVILDSGVDKTHPFLAGKVVAEACYSTTSSTTTSVCPGGVSQSTAPGSGVNCSADGCAHGTHVAGIAAGKSATISGVARDANIIAIQTASSINNCTTPGNCIGLFTSDILLGLQQVQVFAGTFTIAAVNMSLGGGKYTSNCDSSDPATKAAIDNLRSLGIATIVASGNESYTGSLSSPACISSAISVGSTGDGSVGSIADAISSYSSSASFLNLLAPGEYITSSVPGGGFDTYRGTSMATPHVTGAWAVLKSKSPNATVPQVLSALASTGLSVTDPRNGIAKPRIRVDAAANALSSSSCTLSISPSTQSFSANSSTGIVNVGAGTNCAWTATSNDSWLGITSGSTGSGNGTVSFSVANNNGVDRIGTLFIAGSTFIVTQTGIPGLAVDDGSFENSVGLAYGGTSWRVNRLAPTSYPATINAVAIFFPSGTTGPNVGDPLNVVVGSNQSGSSSISGIVLRSTQATVQALDRFNIYTIPGITINTGDVVVGVQMSHASGILPFALDQTPPSQGRSYRSTDGTTFATTDSVGIPGNYGIRAVLTQTLTCPTIAGLNPTSGLAGSTVTMAGTGFTGVTAVKFASNLSARFTINSDTGITATVPDAAVTGPIVISSASCADVQSQTFTVTLCGSIAPTSQSFATAGGTGSITVTTTDNCPWTASSNVSWITINSGSSGSGNGTVNYTVAANTNSADRTGTITVSQRTFTVTQSGVGCAPIPISLGQIVNGALTSGSCPSTLRSGKYAARYSFSGTAGLTVSILLASSAFDTYLYLIGPDGATVAYNDDGGGGLNSRIPPSSGYLTLTTNGTYTIEATSASSSATGNYTLTLSSGTPCTYAISPTSQSIGSGGGTGSVSVTSGSSCNWQATSQASWVTITAGSSGTGNGTVNYTVAANNGTSSRIGTLLIGDQTFTVSQAAASTCPTVSSISPAVAAAGATVTLTGTNLSGVTAVKFSNNLPAASTSIVNSTQIAARVPVGALTGPITLSAPSCTDLLTSPFGITQSTLYFPRLVTTDGTGKTPDDSEYTGIGLVNLDNSDGILALTALDKSGSPIAGANITNPAALALTKGAQLPIVDFQVFGSGLPARKPVGWMKVESSIRKLVGFFLAFNGSLSVQDGADCSSATLSSFIFPEIEDQGFTQIHVANPDPGASAIITFNLIRSDGIQRAAAVNRSVSSNGAVAEFITDLFPGVTPVGSDYLRVSSNSTMGVVPFEWLGKTGLYVEGLNGQDATGGATTLYCPQYVVGPGYRTTLSVVNLDSVAGIVTFRFIRDDGTQIGATQQVYISAQGKIYVTDQKFFLDPGNTLTQGYLEIVSSGPKLAGSVVFGDPGRTTFSSALPLVSTLRTAVIFSQVASNATYFTGLAVLNPSTSAANATLNVYDGNGALSRTRSLTIGARQRISQVLTQYFPDLTGQNISSGYITLTVDKGVASFALFGTNNLSLLSAIPPQVVPSGTPVSWPQITSLSPSSGILGSTINLTITGANLSGATAVNFTSNSGITVTGIQSTSTQVTLSAIIASSAATGPRSVTVVTAGGTSNFLTFTVNPITPAPQITSLSPSSGSQGSTISLTITGTNLSAATAVNFTSNSGITVTGIQSTSTQVTCSVAIASSAATGSRSVTVTTAGGTSGALTFTVNLAIPAPQITSLNPSSGSQGSTISLTITGTNLSAATAVNFTSSSGITVTGIQSTSTQVTCSVAIASSAATGSRSVTVTTAGGTSGTLTFTVNLAIPTPQITSLSPNSGTQGRTISLTIAGTNLSGATGVNFTSSSGITVTGIQSTSTQVTCSVAIASSASTGSRSVTVTTAGGTSGALTFTVNQAILTPQITSLSPNSGAQGTTLNLTITGTNLDGATAVNFGSGSGITAAGIQSTSTQVTCSVTISSGITAGARSVTVVTPGGTSNSLTFTVPAYGTPPTISNLSVTVPSWNNLWGTPETITGSFDFTDPDGDIIYTGSLTGSAKLKFTASLGGSSCTLTTTGSYLDKAGQTSGRVNFTFVLSGYGSVSIGSFSVSFQMLDVAGNASNTLSFNPGTWYCDLFKSLAPPDHEKNPPVAALPGQGWRKTSSPWARVFAAHRSVSVRLS
jgi:subtilisin family serine protease